MRKLKRIFKMINVLIKYIYYMSYCKFRKIESNSLWLISERGNDARDNGYHLFKYIVKKHPEINVKYIIDSSSADFAKVNKLGNVIEFNSKEHYISLMTAERLISTHIMGYTPDMSLFTRLDKLNLLRFKGKRIFLQHGIISNKLPIIPKCDLFICGATKEYDFLSKVYPSLKKVLKNTGLARYDNLKPPRKVSKKILFMPTFRRWLNYVTDDEYMESKYFKGIENLLNSIELAKVLEDNDYKMIFYPHYETQKRLHLFTTNNRRIEIASFDKFDVQQLLIECDILITDFSSVFFDFAYMHKPLIYYQTDTSEYRKKHYSEGYFNYEKDGFGPVVTSDEELCKNLSETLLNKSKIKEKYNKRINNFFNKTDRNNCKRIFDEISKVSGE